MSVNLLDQKNSSRKREVPEKLLSRMRIIALQHIDIRSIHLPCFRLEFNARHSGPISTRGVVTLEPKREQGEGIL